MVCTLSRNEVFEHCESLVSDQLGWQAVGEMRPVTHLIPGSLPAM
jgi:hypothetical protein